TSWRREDLRAGRPGGALVASFSASDRCPSVWRLRSPSWPARWPGWPPRRERPDQVWALDFQFDTTSDGRLLKLLHIVDEHNREALAIQVERRIDADHTVGCSTGSSPSAASHPSSCGWTTAPS